MPISLAERLTDQQLQILSEQWRPAAVEILALRARVAKLEAALREARGWVNHFDQADNYQRGATLARIDAALSETVEA